MTRRTADPDDREARLAEALRANLRRRKAQARARSDAAGCRAPDDAAAAPRGTEDAAPETPPRRR